MSDFKAKDQILQKILNEPKPLSQSQIDAVISESHHTKIIAGAGAGKTETLTRRIVYLLLVKKVDPSEIVAFTFTEKAAKSMKSRVYERLKHIGGEDECLRLGDMYIGTIHGYCNRVLTNEFKHGNYKILDDKQEMAYIMRRGWKLKLFREGRSYSNECDKFLRSLNVVYGEMIDDSILETGAPDFYLKMKEYEGYLEKNKCLTFNLLIKRAIECFEEQPEIAHRVKYLIVDEYQDINRAQEKLIHILGDNNNVFIVGDPRQTIYQWRGSDEKCFSDFSQYYTDTKEININENRRSTREVIESANIFADSFTGEKYEHMIPDPDKAKGGVYCVETYTDDDESKAVVDEIERLVGSGKCRYKDIAILFRSVKTSAGKFIQRMTERKIPFIVGGKIGLFTRPEIKALGLLFCWVCDDGFWQEKYSSKDDRITGDNLLEVADQFWQEGMDKTLPREELQNWKIAVNFEEFKTFTEVYFNLLSRLGFDDLDPEDEYECSVLSNMGKFNVLLNDFESVYRLGGDDKEWSRDLKNLCYYINGYASSNYEEQIGEDASNDDAVQVMTIHQSKGLEWSVVFIPSLVVKRFPSSNMGRRQKWCFDRSLISENVAVKYDGNENSERKLLYVAMTRAKNVVIFTYFTRLGERKKGRSIFLADIDRISTPLVLSDNNHLPDCVYSCSYSVDELLTFEVREILDYCKCPLLYRFRHVWGFQSSLSEFLGYGTSLHFCLREIGSRFAKENIEIADLASSITTKNFHLPYCSKKKFKTVHDAAVRDIVKFVKKYEDDMKNIRDVETHIEFEHQRTILSGQIDVIIHKDRNIKSIEVRDYKTKYDVVSDDYAKMQLYLYCHGLLSVGENVTDASIAYIQDPDIKKFPVTKDIVDDVLSTVGKKIESVRSGIYDPIPAQDNCQHCDYKVICKSCCVERVFEI